MRRYLLTVMLLAMASSVAAQIKMAGKETIDAFLKSKTYVVLEESPFSAFNMWVEDNLPKIWTITPYEIIEGADFEKKMKEPGTSFLYISQAMFSRTKTSLFRSGTNVFDNVDAYNYTILNLSLGDKSGNLNNMQDVCVVPVSYEEVDYESYDYKFGALVQFIQYYTSYARNKPSGDILDMVKENAPGIRNYELWFVKEELATEVSSAALISKFYDGKVKIVTREDIAAAISQGRSDVAFLHKVGPEGTAGGDSQCYKFIITAKEGKPLYFGSHKITSKKPDAFLDDDFSSLGK